MNIGGTSVALANGGTITTLTTAALSAGGTSDKTTLTLVTITAPVGGDTITGTAAGVLTIPASGITLAAASTATVIGNGALVMGGTADFATIAFANTGGLLKGFTTRAVKPLPLGMGI